MNHKRIVSIKSIANQLEMIQAFKADVDILYNNHQDNWPSNLIHEMRSIHTKFEVMLDQLCQEKAKFLTDQLNNE